MPQPLITEIDTKLQFKHFLFYGLSVISLLFFVFFYIFNLQMENIQNVKNIKERNHVDFEKNNLRDSLVKTYSDIATQASHSDFDKYFIKDSSIHINHLNKELLDFVRINTNYLQIRYLDIKGKEIVNVVWRNGKPVLIPNEKLQNKSKRLYFKQGIKLNKGEIYISKLELNKEYGKIQIPYKPTLRFITAIFDSQQKRRGILIINLCGNRILKYLQKYVINQEAKSYLLNSDGYYLVAPNKGDEWGFMIKGRENKSLAKQHPDVWNKITKNDSGQFFAHGDLYTFTTLNIKKVSSISRQNNFFSENPSVINTRTWKIVSIISHSFIKRMKLDLAIKFILIFIFLALLSLIACWYFSLYKIRHDIYFKRAKVLEVGIKHSPVSVLIMNSNGIISYANKAFSKISGYSAEEIVGQHTNLLAHGKYDHAFYDNILDDVLNNGRWKGEICNKSKDGTSFWESVYISSIKDHKDRITHYIAVKENISEKRIIQQRATLHKNALSMINTVEANRNYKLLCETVSKAMGATRVSIYYYNKQMDLLESHLSYTSDGDGEISEEKKIFELGLYPSFRKSLLNGLMIAVENVFEDSRVNELEEYFKEHSISSLLNISIESNGIPIGVIFLELTGRFREWHADDIAFAKHIGNIASLWHAQNKNDKFQEKLKKEKERAEDSNNAKSDFLSSMSHELRTPLNGILGFAQLLEMNTHNNLVEKDLEKAHEIIKSGNHLLMLINEILDLSKIEGRQMNVSIESINLNDVIKDIVVTGTPMAEQRGIDIVVENEFSDLFINSDLTRIKQVFLNILSNAIKYNNQNGKVNIAVVGKDKFVKISFYNTGKGLSEESLNKIFNPFERLGAEGTSVEGTGIGLSITKKLVELMDGEIYVESTIDVGTTFYVEMPRSSAIAEHGKHLDMSQLDDVSHSNAGKENFKIIYIEDNKANIKLVENVLSLRPQVEITSVADPKIGLDLIRSDSFDLILLDINLHGISGFAILKQLKADQHTHDIPVLALSANAMPADIRRGKEAGFEEYITKPINVAEFLATVDHFIGKSNG